MDVKETEATHAGAVVFHGPAVDITLVEYRFLPKLNKPRRYGG